MLTGSLHTVFGWKVNVPVSSNERSLRNFPMQANGAEMLRLACCLATDQGVRVVAPVHDALLIEAPLDALEATVATTQECMRKASEVVLGGFPLRSDAKVVRDPDRYQDFPLLRLRSRRHRFRCVSSPIWPTPCSRSGLAK